LAPAALISEFCIGDGMIGPPRDEDDRLLVSVLVLVTLLVPGGVTADTASQKFSREPQARIPP